jgi:hypothetical protein
MLATLSLERDGCESSWLVRGVETSLDCSDCNLRFERDRTFRVFYEYQGGCLVDPELDAPFYGDPSETNTYWTLGTGVTYAGIDYGTALLVGTADTYAGYGDYGPYPYPIAHLEWDAAEEAFAWQTGRAPLGNDYRHYQTEAEATWRGQGVVRAVDE